MLQTTTQEKQFVAATDTEPAADRRQDAIMKIVQESGVSTGEAARTLVWVNKLAKKARHPKQLTDGLYHLTDDELGSREYRVFDSVVSHGLISKPDSAHAAIERFVLKDDEFGLMHDQVGEQKKYCTVSITVERAS